MISWKRFCPREVCHIWTGILVLAAAFSIQPLHLGVAAEKDKGPNIVLILADDLGYGDLGCYGQKVLKTPRLDRMAAEGLRFTDFYAGSTVCAPSRCVLLTGQHLGHTAIRGNAPSLLRDGDVTIAEILKRAGYRTACIGKWGVGHPPPLDNPHREGFDHFFGYINMWHAHNFYPEFLIRDGKPQPLGNIVGNKFRAMQDLKDPQAGRGVAVKRADYAPELFIHDALRFIDQNRDRPFFLYLPLNTPHANNEAGKQGMEVPDRKPFDAQDWPEPEQGFARMIADIDRDVGRILDRLKEHHIDQNTLVFFTSDNGPHNEGGHSFRFFDSNGPLQGHKRDLYEGGIRVPMIAWWPGTIAGRRETDHLAYFGDFMATFCDLVQADPPKPAGGLDSVSFLPALLGEADRQNRHEFLYWEFYEQGSAQAVRFGTWKAVRKPMRTGPIELYDLSRDLGEANNIAAERPDLVKRAETYMKQAHTPHPTLRPPMPKK